MTALKPAPYVLPFKKPVESKLWDEENKTIDVAVYNQALKNAIGRVDEKITYENRQKEKAFAYWLRKYQTKYMNAYVPYTQEELVEDDRRLNQEEGYNR